MSSGNKYLSLMKGSLKEKKRKPKNINFLSVPPLSFQHWANSPSTWHTVAGPYLKTFWLAFLFWKFLWFFIISFPWDLKASKGPFSSYLSLTSYQKFFMFCKIHTIPCELWWLKANDVLVLAMSAESDIPFTQSFLPELVHNFTQSCISLECLRLTRMCR